MIEPLDAGDQVVVLGLGIYGRAVTDALTRRGIDVRVIEDRPTDDTHRFAADAGVALHVAPDAGSLRSLRSILGGATAFVPSPGVPERHTAFEVAAELGVPIVSELDMARWWDDRPIGSVTGTDGKTTVTMLTVEMLSAAGIEARAVGNTETPLVTAIDDPEVEVFVVEASSFRLAHTQCFTPRVAAWLNFGADHLDVHRDLASYESAKARIWADLPEDGLAVAVGDDATVMSHLRTDRRSIVVGGPDADATVVDGDLVVSGTTVGSVADMSRRFEHDITNTLVAAAIAGELGAPADAIRQAIAAHVGLPHRIQHVATVDGVEYYNDSKATVPHAVLTAVESFDSVVLIAGGRNKGLDLRPLAGAGERISAVVAMGECADEIVEAFRGSATIARAVDMGDAVRLARSLASSGDVVLLSPGCASYDAYTSYTARGDDFIRVVRMLSEGVPQ